MFCLFIRNPVHSDNKYGFDWQIGLWTLLLLALLLPSSLQAQEPVWEDYGRLLDRHIRQKSQQGISLAWLDYPGIGKDPDFQRSVTRLEGFNIERLEGREEKLAFYINAYNILAIKMVLDNWPVKSIKDIGSWFNPVWKKNAGNIGGKSITLNDIEHLILRPMHEPRIHMAIVCASLSCPDLRQEPYTASLLEQQLEEQSQLFLNNPEKGLRLEGKRIKPSKIFDWFSEDFPDRTTFFRTYRPDLPSQVTIDGFLPYNWSLNGNH